MNNPFNTIIDSGAALARYIQQVGFLPMFDSGIAGFSANDVVVSDCRYQLLPDGGWEWPLWKWKGSIVTTGDCVYGKFFNKKAGFVSRRWWPDLLNYRRSRWPMPQEGSIEEAVLATLQLDGSLITRELRAACGFTGKNMRSKFDAYVTRLEMGCYIVTEDFVYPTDRHGREYGWGWSMLTTPERLYGRDACHTTHTPDESRQLMADHLGQLLPQATQRQIDKLIG